MKLVPFTARSLVTDNVPPTLVFPEAATTSNLFVSTVKLPPTPNVPPTVVLPLDAVTSNLSVLTVKFPPTMVSPVAATTVNLSVFPTINWLLVVKYPAVYIFPLDDWIVTLSALLLFCIFISSVKVVSPATDNAPPNVEAPVPTVNVFASATLTLSFNVVAPVTVNVPSVLISPDVAAILALLVAPLTTCNPLLKTAFWAKVEVLLAVNTPWTVRFAADSNDPPFAPILVKDGNPVIEPCVLDVTVPAEPLTLPVTLPV